MELDLSPECLLSAYASGIFPMADDGGRVRWFAPDPRAILELETFRPSRSLRAVMRRGRFEITVNRAFAAVIEACADRPAGTWISPEICEAYVRLHEGGFAHSVETWHESGLVGGLYGVALGGAFFGESMFHRATDASKVALTVLVDRLRWRGFTLLDVQFMTEHLRSLGAIEIPRTVYLRRLRASLRIPCVFDDRTGPTAVEFASTDEDD